MASTLQAGPTKPLLNLTGAKHINSNLFVNGLGQNNAHTSQHFARAS